MEHVAYKPAANRGFTLIETVITIVILGAVAGILVPFFNAIVHSPDPVIRERAISMGQGMMDEIMAKRWDEDTPMGGGPICTGESTSKGTRPSLVDNCANPGALTASAIGTDTGENQRADYDDVDDYNGINESSNFTDQNGAAFILTGYSRQVSVRYIPSTTNPITHDLPAGSLMNQTDTKRVVVTITSPLGEVFRFVAVACNL
ncbi:MAG: prepilin-type N-terminal cleavage/methylation domain-containing protein [Desulfurivibrionaceae bacterium]|jgi:MSHA pilin protein MshD